MENIRDLDLAEELTGEPTDEQAESKPGRRINPLAVLVLGMIVVIALVFGIALARQNQTQPTEGSAPDFSITTFSGEPLKLSDLRGKVVVVNFWASWCGPCRYEAPTLQAVSQQYLDRGVVFVGIAYTDTERDAKAFLNQYGVTYANGLDIGTRISERYHITGVPETFFIDRKGNIAQFVMAPLDAPSLRSILDRVLAS